MIQDRQLSLTQSQLERSHLPRMIIRKQKCTGAHLSSELLTFVELNMSLTSSETVLVSKRKISLICNFSLIFHKAELLMQIIFVLHSQIVHIKQLRMQVFAVSCLLIFIRLCLI